jgi:hypothetical protein
MEPSEEATKLKILVNKTEIQTRDLMKTDC